MTDEDKKRIAEYIGWKYRSDLWGGIEYFRDTTDGFEQYYIVNFDLNDAGLVVQEMQKRGDWEYFVGDIEDTLIYTRYHKEHHSYKAVLAAWLFNSENFFAAMAQWIKEGKK